MQERSKAKDLEPGQVRFSQREAREATGWSQPQVKRHLAKLSELEYAIVHGGGRGQLWRYELVYKGEGQNGRGFVMGLIDLATMQDDEKRDGQKGEWDGSGMPQAPPKDGGGTPTQKPPQPSNNGALNGSAAQNTKKKEASHA